MGIQGIQLAYKSAPVYIPSRPWVFFYNGTVTFSSVQSTSQLLIPANEQGTPGSPKGSFSLVIPQGMYYGRIYLVWPVSWGSATLGKLTSTPQIPSAWSTVTQVTANILGRSLPVFYSSSTYQDYSPYGQVFSWTVT